MGFSNLKNQCSFLISAIIPKDETKWAFGGWLGERFGDNSGAFLQYMAEEHPENEYYWFANHPNEIKTKLPHNVTVLLRNSKEARKLLLKSKYKVMCQGASDFDDKNLIGGSVNVQLWHGVAWKKIGVDSFEKKKGLLGTLKTYSNVWAHMLQHGGSIYVAPSVTYANSIKSAFLTKDAKILLNGFPRNCILFENHGEKYTKIRSEISRKLGFEDDKKIILYMPTFREKGAERFSFWERISQLSDFHNIVILEKSHFADSKEMHESRDNLFNANEIDSQELLLIADLLITDYSSCFFDYLLLDRPIIQFIYDYPYYRDKDRGLYYSDTDVDCGYIARDEGSLFALLKEFDLSGLAPTKKQLAVKEKFMTYESPDNCKILYDEIERRFMK